MAILNSVYTEQTDEGNIHDCSIWSVEDITNFGSDHAVTKLGKSELNS